jgi:hypothetical protein
MAHMSDEKQLKRCLEAAIKTVHEAINKLEVKQQEHPKQEQTQVAPSRNSLRSNMATDTNINTFTLNKNEEDLMDELKMKLESELDNYLPSLFENCKKYLLQLLHTYSYDYCQRKFTNSFNMGMIQAYFQDLQCTLASLDASKAAWDGNRSAVKDFIEKYPAAKNKPGVFGTTLLYSSARNNRLELV